MSDTPGSFAEEIQWEILEEQIIESLRADPSDKSKPKKEARTIKSIFHIRRTSSSDHTDKQLKIFFDVNMRMRGNHIAEFNVFKATLEAIGLEENVDYEISEFIPGNMDEKILTIKKLDKLKNPKDIFNKTYEMMFQRLYPAKTTMKVLRDAPAKTAPESHQPPISLQKPHTVINIVKSQQSNAQSMLDKILRERDETERAIKQTTAKEKITLSTITQFSEIKNKINDEIFFGTSSSDSEQLLRLKLISAKLLTIRDEVLKLTTVNPLSLLTASSSALAAKVQSANVKIKEKLNASAIRKIEIFKKSPDQLMREIRLSLANLKKIIDDRLGFRKYFRWIPGILSTELQNLIKDTVKLDKALMSGIVSLEIAEKQLKDLTTKHGNTKFKTQVEAALSPIQNSPELSKVKSVSSKQETLEYEKPTTLVFSNQQTDKLSTSKIKTKKKKKTKKIKKVKNLRADLSFTPLSNDKYSFKGDEWTWIGPQGKEPKDPTTIPSPNKRNRRRK